MKKKATKEKTVRISKDWKIFTKNLASVLSDMIEDQFLIINVKQSNRFIQFAAQGSFGMRAEISSNAYLPVSDRITDRQVADLVTTGWEAPTGSPSESTPENDPDGSVAVGTALASRPPHRSVHAGLPHTALTSGE